MKKRRRAYANHGLVSGKARAVQRAMLVKYLPGGADDYRRLSGKYGHAKLWQAFSSAIDAQQTAGTAQRWANRAHRGVKRALRVLESMQTWLERG